MDWARIGSTAYWTTFTVAFLLVAAWESRAPERPWVVPAGRRWTVHGLLMISGALLRAAVLRLSPVAVAMGPARSWSFPWASGLPVWVGVPVAVLLLDLSKYFTHRLFHAIPWFWRVHRVHHSDPDFDVSTGLRFHPLEPLLPVASDLLLIQLFALPVEGVIAAQLVSVASNFFEHANADVPDAWGKVLRGWLVLPRTHRIHHSDAFGDQQTNFGEAFVWWDKLFGTYRDRSEAGGTFAVGLPGYQEPRSVEFVEMLMQPFHAERATENSADLLAAASEDQESASDQSHG
ncbi:MAG: sterol desaturase family protein [Bryobacteraceae bacterium]